MKHDELERAILLAQSGELPKHEREKLEAALKDSPEARAYREDVHRIVDLADRHLPCGQPDETTLRGILDAGRPPHQGPSAILFRPAVLQVLAYAAVLLLVLGGWFLWTPNGRAARIDEMRAIVSVVSEDGGVITSEVSRADDSEAELRALAHQLLMMEGLAQDSMGGDGEDDAETMEGQELPPTVLQWRNTRAPPSRRYG